MNKIKSIQGQILFYHSNFIYFLCISPDGEIFVLTLQSMGGWNPPPSYIFLYCLGTIRVSVFIFGDFYIHVLTIKCSKFRVIRSIYEKIMAFGKKLVDYTLRDDHPVWQMLVVIFDLPTDPKSGSWFDLEI